MNEDKIASYAEMYVLLSDKTIEEMVVEISREIRELGGNDKYIDEHVIQLAALKQVAADRKGSIS